MATLLLLGRRAGAFVAPRCRVVAARREMTLMPRDEQTISPLPYKGVLYDLRGSSAAYTDVSVDDFAVRLGALERAWRDEAQLSGWVALPLRDSRAGGGEPSCTAEGDSMVLYKWFGAGEDKVPPYGNTQVGCAGFVVNDKNEILVVKEWQSASGGADACRRRTGSCPAAWRTGASPSSSAPRGRRSRRRASRAAPWRPRHVAPPASRPWGKSDIYCVVRLEPLGPLAIDADPERSATAMVRRRGLRGGGRHPLITKVLAEVRLARRRPSGAFEPKCDFANLGVQWPGRDPYATYFPKVSGAKRLPTRIRAGNNRWNGPVQQNFKPLHLGQIEARIRAVASDVDGTLLDSASVLHADNAAAIAACAAHPGLRFFLATGKCRAGALAALPAAVAEALHGGVFVNGLVVYDDGGAVVHERLLAGDVVADAVGFADGLGLDVLARRTATAKQVTTGEDFPPDVTTYFEYVITHSDGSRTLLSVKDVNGVKTSSSKKDDSGAPPARKPIQPPLNLPLGAGWKAKRVRRRPKQIRRGAVDASFSQAVDALTDASGVETATTVYTVVLDGQMYTQTEVQVGTGPVGVSKSAAAARRPTRARRRRGARLGGAGCSRGFSAAKNPGYHKETRTRTAPVRMVEAPTKKPAAKTKKTATAKKPAATKSPVIGKNGATVRKGESLESEIVDKVAIDDTVLVEEENADKTRVRIDDPEAGSRPSAAAEQEEGLAFAEAFGVGISLHFKLGKLLLSLLFAAAVLQLPALALYARHGQFRAHAEPVAPYGAGSLSVLDGAALALLDGGRARAGKRRRDAARAAARHPRRVLLRRLRDPGAVERRGGGARLRAARRAQRSGAGAEARALALLLRGVSPGDGGDAAGGRSTTWPATGPEAVATAAPTAFNATALSDDGAPEPSDPFHSAKHALAPYLTREPSAKRHALFLVLIVVCLNSVLRILVRRGAVFGAHSTRTTEQSAALLAYWASTTLNTTGCYALAAWRGAVWNSNLQPDFNVRICDSAASKHAEGAMLSRWYADVGVYLLTTLLWEALAPPAGAPAARSADALGALRVRAFFWRRRGPGVARAPSLGGDEALELEDRAFDLRSCLP
ncbi:8-hydroxy-dADP phosphatase [Aureococcus anophagefferens]|nr:8-hydroxy-dADP phosphatase [Aureococcus anophagefferens]